MKKKIFFYLLILLYLSVGQVSSLENKIILKINNKIITTFDIEQEKKYLAVLNENLNKIDQNKFEILATESIIKEKIKEIEITKYFEIEKTLNDTNLKKIIKNLYQNAGYQSEEEFKNYLELLNLNYQLIKKKIAIEMLWNNLIFRKFINRVVIDEKEIKDNLDNEIKNIIFSRNLYLSEIIIKNSKDLEIEKIYSEILKSIENIGFGATANIFSISDTAKIGGKIGWVEETSLSKQILKNIINLKKNQISKPIKINENFLILNIDDIKINKQEIDKNEILKNRISYVKNQQLERFSLAYFSKVKQNMQINEF
jgi:peptidyl-prolyl cis-trans isomerase SurA